MKDLRKILEASILDIEDTLSKNEKDLYPIPKIKDFYKVPRGISIQWYCPGIISNYLQYIKCVKPQSLQSVSSTVDLSKIDSICCICRTHGECFITLGIREYDDYTNFMPLECSRGKFQFQNTPGVKKSILKLFKMLADNPENFKKLFEMHNDVCEKEYSTTTPNGYPYWDSRSEYAHQSIDDIIKQLK